MLPPYEHDNTQATANPLKVTAREILGFRVIDEASDRAHIISQVILHDACYLRLRIHAKVVYLQESACAAPKKRKLRLDISSRQIS